jgi:non-specific serine/threonine protein kinase
MSDNLPVPLTSFVGRAREIADVRRLLAGTRLLTLTGAGGAGKTRLAVEVATSELADYADGIWLVELASLAEPALVPATVAAALGLREDPRRPLQSALTEHLRSRSLLLVLDNCEHLIEACAELAEALLHACPRLQILATSRQALGITGETAWRVPPMALPRESKDQGSRSNGGSAPIVDDEPALDSDAVRLFVERATAANVQFSLTERNAAAVVEICRRLDAIPLALELAAARVKALTVAQIAARLDDRFRLLTTGSRTALPRQQTLRGTLDWSYDLLSVPERELLRRVAVFVGGWTLESAELIAAPDALDALTGLVDKSLVLAEEQDGEQRYRLLDTLRRYALEHLEASGEADAVRRRHALCYLALAEEAEPHLRGPRQVEWLERLRAEHDNLRAALDWLAAHDPQLGLRLGAALWRFWDTHGHLSEGRERLAALLERGETRGQAAAQALHGQGVLARKQGDFDAARLLHEESLAIHRERGDREGIAHALNSLGMVFHAKGDFETARAMKAESLATMRELGDEWGTAAGLNNLALVLKDMGNLAAALPLEEESLALMRRLGDERGVSNTLANLGVTANRLGDFATARARHEESLALKRGLGDRSGIAHSLRNLGQVALAQGDYAAAGAWFEEALRLTWQLGDRLMLAACLHGLGAVADARGRPHEAVRLYGAAEALRDAIGTRLPQPRRTDDDQRVHAARATLAEEAFAALWAEGQAMPLDAAVAYALSMAASSAASAQRAAKDDEIPLSAREREVAALLAQGLTNRQIADELVVATSTVDRHVANIFRKLDLTSRAQVAVWAVEHGLVAASN